MLPNNLIPGIGGAESDGNSLAPDLTPIIDVVVALLGTLMMLVGMQFVFGDVEMAEIQRGAAVTPPSDPPVTLTLTRDGAVLWDGQPVTFSELPSKLSAVASHDLRSSSHPKVESDSDKTTTATTRVIIAGDRDVSLGRAVELWSLVKSAGLTALMAAEPAKGP